MNPTRRTLRCLVSAFASVLGLLACPTAALPAPAGDASIRQITLGRDHGCAVTQGGDLACWGSNQHGQIGLGIDTPQMPRPALVLSGGVTQASAGYAHTCAIRHGALDCWGWNGSGQVGSGTVEARTLAPTRVFDSGVTAVSAGGMHTCAIVSGALQCWGYNASGQIRNSGSAGADNEPKPVTVIAQGVTEVSAGSQHTCAIVQGALQCWGSNRDGQIGHGPASPSVATPVTVLPRGATAVSASGSFTCAVADGALWCWGRFDGKGIGPNAKSITPTPTKIIASGVSAVATGEAHVCAVVDTALQCLGYDGSGAFGTGQSPAMVTTPRTVLASGVSAVMASSGKTCVFVRGALRCRGYSPEGRIAEKMEPFEYRPFDQDGGDVTAIDVAAARVVTESLQSPAKIAAQLQHQIVLLGEAVYRVEAAHASLDYRTQLSLQLDVLPIMSVHQRPSASGNPAQTEIEVPATTPCGDDTASLPSQLDSTEVQVLHDAGFVDLKQHLQASVAALPEIPNPGRYRSSGTPILLSSIQGADRARLQACVRQTVAAVEARPVGAILYRMGEDTRSVPHTLSGIWNAPVGKRNVAQLTVRRKPGFNGEVTIAAQPIGALRCGEALVSYTSGNQLEPWILSSSTELFEIDRDLLDDDAPLHLPMTRRAIRRALNADQGLPGLAPEAEAQACRAVVTGESYSVRYNGQPVQDLYIPYASDREPTPWTCDSTARQPLKALHVAANLGHAIGGGGNGYGYFASCKALPDEPGKTLVALAFPSKGAARNEPDTFDLDVLIVDSNNLKVLSRHHSEGALQSDAYRLSHVGIDTGRYRLAPGVRAFGIRVAHAVNSHIVPTDEEVLTLYVARGARIEPVASGLMMSYNHMETGADCAAEMSATQRTVRIGPLPKQGYADLIVTTKQSQSTQELVGEECVDHVVHSSTRSDVVPFDGQRYPLPTALQNP